MTALAPLIERAFGSPADDTSPGASLNAHPDIAFGIVESVEGIEALAEEWGDLFDRAGLSHQMFQSPLWCRAWTQHFVAGGSAMGPRPAIVTARRNGRLALVWPLVRRRRTGVDILSWLGDPASQYGDVIIEGGPGKAALLGATWQHIRSCLKPDVVVLRKVRSDASIAPLLSLPGARLTRRSEAPFLDLASASSFDEYEKRYSGKARKNRRRLLRRLSEAGKVGFVHAASEAEAIRLTHDAVRMKRAWLARRGTIVSALYDEQLVRFLEEFPHACGEISREVSAITLDDKPLSIMVAFSCKGRTAGHVFAYDISAERYGAGVLLLEELVRAAFARGRHTLDLLAPLDAYKLDWADATVPVGDWSIALSPAGLAYQRIYLELVREPLRRLAEWIPSGMPHWSLPAFTLGRFSSRDPAARASDADPGPDRA